MSDGTKRTAVYWNDLNRSVSERVENALASEASNPDSLIWSLRQLEEMARRECDRRDTIQVLVSGRRLLGDRSTVGISNGPFSLT